MFRWLTSFFSHSELREEIKKHEAGGHTDQTNSMLHELNCEQTNRLSDQGLQNLIKERTAQRKDVTKLVAAARDRGIPIPTNLSDAGLKSAIKERESHGYTGRTDSVTHALNCAQTDRLSTSGLDSLIESRRAQDLPTEKLEAARRDRG